MGAIYLTILLSIIPIAVAAGSYATLTKGLKEEYRANREEFKAHRAENAVALARLDATVDRLAETATDLKVAFAKIDVRVKHVERATPGFGNPIVKPAPQEPDDT